MRSSAGPADQRGELHRQLGMYAGIAASLAVALAVLVMLTGSRSEAGTQLFAERSRTLAARLTPPAKPESAIHKIDETAEYETYSNGLVVINTWRSPGRSRTAYPVFPAGTGDHLREQWQSAPAGIVYHSTESHALDMDEEWQPDLPRIETYLLDYLRERRLYHFFVDRTGRVFRVVPESDIAYHAGRSVWGDAQYVYVNLNASFLGVAFERQASGSDGRLTPDQIQSARLLTDMLRTKYRIPPSNCVTHAQVSVNPANMIIGAHTDWADDFPFEKLGLGDNYAQPSAAVLAFGFDYDDALVRAAGGRTWPGLLRADKQVRERASAQGVSVAEYKAGLQRRFRHILATNDVDSGS